MSILIVHVHREVSSYYVFNYHECSCFEYECNYLTFEYAEDESASHRNDND